MRMRMAAITVAACLAACAAAQQDTTPQSADSAAVWERELKGITVKSKKIVTKDGRRIVRPSEELLGQAADGTDVLRRMQLPRISVNPLTGEIGLQGGGRLRLAINGMQVSATEIAALTPADIVRIEYHESPGARYAGADAVIDYIVRHNSAGGNVAGNLFHVMGDQNGAIDHLSARRSSGRSETAADVSLFMLHRDDWRREFDETLVLPGGTVRRTETGLPTPIDQTSVRGNLSYSLTDTGNYLLSARLTYAFNDIPRSEESDRRNLLSTSEADRPINIYEHSEERSNSPSLDLYFMKQLPGNGQLAFDLTGTYIGTSARRVYQESRDGVTLTDVLQDVDGGRYSVIAEGFYERRMGTHRLTVGARHTQAYTSNRYTGSIGARVNMRQAESAVYAEYGRHTGPWDYMLNLTASRLRYAQGAAVTCHREIEPSGRVTFAPCRDVSLRYSIGLLATAPDIAAMNDVEQTIDEHQVRRGNPYLKVFRTLRQTFAVSAAKGMVSADLNVGFDHEYSPIMEQVLEEQGMLIRTWHNQKSFDRLNATLSLKVEPWKNHLTLSVSPRIDRYISRGNGYLHTCTLFDMPAQADFTAGCWMASVQVEERHCNGMYGEQIMKEDNMLMVTVGYKRPKWQLSAGCINPFMSRYTMETRNRTALCQSVSRATSLKATSLVVRMSFNIGYGRQTQETHKRINNEDTDTGIMRGTK